MYLFRVAGEIHDQSADQGKWQVVLPEQAAHEAHAPLQILCITLHLHQNES